MGCGAATAPGFLELAGRVSWRASPPLSGRGVASSGQGGLGGGRVGARWLLRCSADGEVYSAGSTLFDLLAVPDVLEGHESTGAWTQELCVFFCI